jgi:hypothetical protein
VMPFAGTSLVYAPKLRGYLPKTRGSELYPVCRRDGVGPPDAEGHLSVTHIRDRLGLTVADGTLMPDNSTRSKNLVPSRPGGLHGHLPQV